MHLLRMLRLFQPCLPIRAPKPATGENWLHEIKHDGFRIVARRINGVVRLQTKQGYDYAERYPLIVEAIARLKVPSIVIDGEANKLTDSQHLQPQHVAEGSPRCRLRTKRNCAACV